MSHFVYPINFACTIITENVIFPNSYTISLSIEPNNENSKVGLGIKKLKNFVDICLRNSLIISDESQFKDSLLILENNKVLLPCEPYDYFIGSVLFSKFIAVSEKYFSIDFFTIDSAVGEFVQYTLESPDDSGLELQGDNWWNLDSLYTGQGETISWEELDLDDGPKFTPKIIKGGLSKK